MNRLTLVPLIVIVALSCAISMPRSKRCVLISDDSNLMEQMTANSAVHIRSDGNGKSISTSEMKKLDKNRVNPKESLKTKVEQIDNLLELSKYKESPNNILSRELVNKKFNQQEDKIDSKKPSQNGAKAKDANMRQNIEPAFEYLTEGTESQKFGEDTLDERDGGNGYNSMFMKLPKFLGGTDDDDDLNLHNDRSIFFGDKKQEAANKKLAENTEKIYQFSKALIKNPSFVDNRPKSLIDKTINKSLKTGELPTSSADEATTGVGASKTSPSQNPKSTQYTKNAKVGEMPENPEDTVDEHEQGAEDEDESESENDNDEREYQPEHHGNEKALKQNEQQQLIRPLKTHQRAQIDASYFRQPSRPFAPRVGNIGRRAFDNVDFFPLDPNADYDDIDTGDYPYRSRNSMSSNKPPSRSRHHIANSMQSYLSNENDDYPENEIKIRCPPHRVLSKKSNYDDDDYFDNDAINDRGMVCSCHFMKNKKKNVRCGHW